MLIEELIAMMMVERARPATERYANLRYRKQPYQSAPAVHVRECDWIRGCSGRFHLNGNGLFARHMSSQYTCPSGWLACSPTTLLSWKR